MKINDEHHGNFIEKQPAKLEQNTKSIEIIYPKLFILKLSMGIFPIQVEKLKRKSFIRVSTMLCARKLILMSTNWYDTVVS